MQRALMLGLLCAGCSAAQHPGVGRAGMVMAITGVAGIVASATIGQKTSQGDEMMIGAEALSAAGIVLFASHEMSGPEIVYKQESLEHKHTRWARVLTEHAVGAARDGNCARVRKWEPRVRVYDVNVHDLVFMRDPEILRCLEPAIPEPRAIELTPEPQ